MKSLLLPHLLFLSVLNSFACDCDPLKTVELDDCPYTFIFKGMVIDTIVQNGQGVVRFEVQRSFIGDPGESISVSFDNSTSCLMSFAPGEIWLIYCKTDKFRRSSVHFCGHSRKFISVNKNEDHYYQVRLTTFEEEENSLSHLHPNGPDFVKEKVEEMPFRQLEHPARGTAIWYILAALPVLFLLWWLLKKYLK